MISLAFDIVFVALLAWFYPHCIRPSLDWSHARPNAYRLAAFGCILAAVAFTADAAIFELFPTQRVWIPPLVALTAIGFAIAAIAWGRPRWIVRVTGGPERRIAR
ncbi:MAG TPA: hypothetical protein VFY18_04415 [Candidatus Limnocylindrales bacterium]|nr:hypothetical protein [Candidatus Limnocylindrales bacterium]